MTAADEHADGLTESEATGRLARDGPNELPRSKPKNILRLLREIVTEPIFLLLVACGVIYMLLGDKHEAMMLLGFVFVVMGISFYQQRRTERSLEALRDISSPRALIWREGVARRIPGTEVVCGDIVLLAEGDRVPADILLTESSNLNVDESMLTGESVPVSKYAQSRSEHMADAPNPVSLVFSGTLITQGTARGYVIATGERSALGKIGKSLSDIEVDVTPIQKETGQVVKRVAVAGLLLAAALAISYGVSYGRRPRRTTTSSQRRRSLFRRRSIHCLNMQFWQVTGRHSTRWRLLLHRPAWNCWREPNIFTLTGLYCTTILCRRNSWPCHAHGSRRT